MKISNQHLELFQCLFRGREDVYARRWEKEDQSGYMPAYNVDWDKYERHKALGGSFQNFKHKDLAPLTPAVIQRHLSGKETIGIYPLLAADFDKENWFEESRQFVQVCRQHKLPACLERSRSGNGGHVWFFFKNPVLHGKVEKLLSIYYERLVFCQNLKRKAVLTGCSPPRIIIQVKVWAILLPCR